MASIAKTPLGKYRVQWREAGRQRQKNFASHAEAKKFAAALELSPQKRRSMISVGDWIANYRDTEAVKKKGARSEIFRLNRFLKRSFASLKLSEITVKDLQKYIDERSLEPSRKYSSTVSPGTIAREVTTLSAAFSKAVKAGLIETNPASGLVLPKPPENRERVASEKDIEKLMVASGWDGESVPVTLQQLVMVAFLFACRTGMRSGEILRIEEAWIQGRTIHLPAAASKTNSKRDIALSSEALRLLDLVRKRGDNPQIFGALSDETRDANWRKIRDRADLGPVTDSEGRLVQEGLNFHDSRATFCTWAASPNPKTGAPRLDVLALARQTGHKDLKMLKKYYRASADTIAKQLDE